ncbi:hypothetical protein GGR42_002688 [Saonia flava]|uniref:Uncharacterized protein n=1 Tax=Saonia flava TaxID=523696 RepID=A0A846QYC0_9FLAO|nr:hypothetical protein [Saonia flava]
MCFVIILTEYFYEFAILLGYYFLDIVIIKNSLITLFTILNDIYHFQNRMQSLDLIN